MPSASAASAVDRPSTSRSRNAARSDGGSARDGAVERAAQLARRAAPPPARGGSRRAPRASARRPRRRPRAPGTSRFWLAQPVHRGVVHDAVEPGGEPRAALDAARAGHQLQERLLHHVLGRGRVAEQAQRQPVQPVGPDLEELAEAARLAAAHRLEAGELVALGLPPLPPARVAHSSHYSTPRQAPPLEPQQALGLVVWPSCAVRSRAEAREPLERGGVGTIGRRQRLLAWRPGRRRTAAQPGRLEAL